MVEALFAIVSLLATAAIPPVDPPAAPRAEANADGGAATPNAPRSAEAKLCGRLDRIGDTPVLYLWGTPRERGFAHGYLLAADIHRALDEYLSNQRLSGGAAGYDKLVREYLRPPFVISSPRTRTELEGLAAGMRAKLGDEGMRVAALNRAIDEPDLLAFSFISDTVGMGCSSFAAWGPLTKDGGTITGRNLDWLHAGELVERQILVVHAPDPGADRDGWIALTWPGCIGCFTGMNAHGVTIAMHDVPGCAVRPPMGVTPRSIVFRDVLERAGGDKPLDSAASVFGAYRIAVGSNAMVTLPAGTRGAPSAAGVIPSAVFELDGYKERARGVTMRPPDEGLEWQACTNHFRRRGMPPTELDDVSPPAADGVPGRCNRYDKLMKRLRRVAAADGDKLDAESAWELLASVAVCAEGRNGCHTLLSVVFEPDARRMTFAVSSGDQPATRGKHMMIDVAERISRARGDSSVSETSR